MPDLFDIIHREWPVIKQAPYSFFISVLVMAFIIWAIFEWRHRKRPQEEASASVKNSGNLTANGGSATGGSVIQYLNPPISTPAEIPKRKPNIHYKSVRTASIKVEEDSDGDILREMNYDTGFTAVLVCIRNDPTVGVRTAEHANAHLTLRDKNGKEIGTGISRACWLNSPADTIDLEPGKPEHVVLLVLEEKGGLFIPWKDLKKPGLTESGTIQIEKTTAIIDLEILDGWGEPLLPLSSFDISIADGRLAGAFRQP